MSASLQPVVQAKTAGEDLSAHQWKIVKLDPTDGTKVLLCGDGEKAYGILASVSGLGKPCEVHVGGGSKVKIASTMSTAGVSFKSGASGVGAAAADAQWALGTTEATGVSGDIIPVLIDRHETAAS